MGLLFYRFESVGAEIGGGIHAVFSYVGRGELEMEAFHLAQRRKFHPCPLIEYLGFPVAEVGKIDLYGAGIFVLRVFAVDFELKPVVGRKFFGKRIAVFHREIGVGAVCYVHAFELMRPAVFKRHHGRGKIVGVGGKVYFARFAFSGYGAVVFKSGGG